MEKIFILKIDDGDNSMIQIKYQNVELLVDRQGNQFEIHLDKHIYRSNPNLPAFYRRQDGSITEFTTLSPQIAEVQKEDGKGITFTYPEFVLEILLKDNATVEFAARPAKEDFRGELCWPAPLDKCNVADSYDVLPIMQGMIIERDEEDCKNILEGEFVTREGTMPWWGQVGDGSGYMAVVETPWDARYTYEHKKNEGTDIRIHWMPSLGSLSYERKMTLYLYDETCNYVQFCHRYRELLDAEGKLLTLRDKAEKTPVLKGMIGNPVCNTPSAYYQIEPESTYYDTEDDSKNYCLNPFTDIAEGLRNIHDAGISNAYVHLDGWSRGGYDNLCPTVLPPNEKAGGKEGLEKLLQTCDEIGYVLAYHDQYRDFYLKSPDYDETQAVVFADGTIQNREEIIWYGGHEVQLCSTKAMNYLKRNYDEMERTGLLPKGVYLDVFSASALDECFSTEHPMTKKECADYRRECFDYLHDKNLVVSSEEIMSEFINDLDLVHHSPYIMPFFEAYDVKPFGKPVPLLNLVFHDCIMVPWFMGKEVWGLPKEEDGFLHCMLCGGVPVVSYKPDEENLRKVKEACALYREVWDSRMISHEFVSADGSCQRAVYDNGITVEVDFKNEEYKIIRG